MNIDWNKIVTQAITALVVGTFMGAAAIVWKGATTVDTKVQATRDDMSHLINALSDKLAGYETQLTTISNQLAAVLKQTSVPVAVHNPWTNALEREVHLQNNRANIYQQLKQAQ